MYAYGTCVFLASWRGVRLPNTRDDGVLLNTMLISSNNAKAAVRLKSLKSGRRSCGHIDCGQSTWDSVSGASQGMKGLTGAKDEQERI